LRIEYTLEAQRDLVEAIDRIHRENPSAAARLADRLLFRIERLAAVVRVYHQAREPIGR
jgi:plasmid stabilization system protein ParE